MRRSRAGALLIQLRQERVILVGQDLIGSVTVQEIRVLSLVIAGLLALMVVLFMKNSRMGQAIRATAQDPRAAKIMGINTDRVYAFTYSLNAAICGSTAFLDGGMA